MITTQQYIEYDINKKSLGVALFLWFFFGWLGAHRIYIGIPNNLVALQAICIALIFLPGATGYAFAAFFILGALMFIDLFRLSGWVHRKNTNILKKLEAGQPVEKKATTPITKEQNFFGIVVIVMLIILAFTLIAQH